MAPRSSQAAVENGVLKRVSPSQVKEYEQCPRKWYFTKVQGLPVVSRNQRQLDFGSALHKEIENFILQGTPLTTPLAIVGKEHIPTAIPGLLVETRVEDPWVYAAGIYVDGYIDLVVPGPVPEIIDWKTTSDIDKWGKTSEELRTDTQMLTYAKWALAKYEAESVRLSHVQFQTKGRPWASKKSTVLTLDETNQAWLKVNHTVANMTVDAGKKSPAEVEGNTDSCDAYGGCPFQHVCPSHTRGRDMSRLLAMLQGKTAGTVNIAVGGVSPNQTLPVVVAEKLLTKAEVKEAFKGPQAVQGQEGVPGPKARMGTVVSPGVMMLTSPPEVRPVVANTPMATLSPIAVVHAPTGLIQRGPPEDITPPDMPGEEVATLAPSKPKEQIVVPDAVLKEANKSLDEAYPTKAKGRPKGSKNKPKDAVGEDKALSDADIKALAESVGAMAGMALRTEFDASAGELENLSQSPAAVLADRAPDLTYADAISDYESRKRKDLRLFINCYPSSPSQDLTSYVNGLNIEASKQEKIPDVRLSESKTLGFGKWKGVLAQLAKAAPPTGDCYISSSDLNDPVIEALIPLAALVVRAR